MATIQNRSRYFVRVKNRDDLTKTFPFNHAKHATTYRDALRADGLKPSIGQEEDTYFVRIRQKGFPEFTHTAKSSTDADNIVKKIEEERHRGLFIDYNKAHKITFAQLLGRYLHEESSKRKSYDLESYKIEGWLDDSGLAGKVLLQKYRDELRTQNKPVRKATQKMRKIAASIGWIHKKLSEIVTTDIEDFMRDRLENVMPATVDRELDIMKSIFKVAINVWEYNLDRNPMDSVRSPKYFNERDRRFVGDEEQRLMQEIVTIDRERSIENKLRMLADAALETTAFTSNSARKKVLASTRKVLRYEAEQTYLHVPLLEAFVQFQLMTAARRGETLDLTWDRVDLVRKTAFLQDTKNGRARKLSLRDDLLKLLAELPRDGELVFPISIKILVDDWTRACVQAKIENFHIHDCRHEGISRVGETGKFTMLDLQVFSGHRDPRMLLRYSHLCATKLAQKLDDAFKDEKYYRVHRGRKTLSRNANVTLRDVLVASGEQILGMEDAIAPPQDGRKPGEEYLALAPLASNVIRFPVRRIG